MSAPNYTGPTGGVVGETASAFFAKEHASAEADTDTSEASVADESETPAGGEESAAGAGQPEPSSELDSEAIEAVESPTEGGYDYDPETPIQVTLPGGVSQDVTLDELRSSYSREADYTRKMEDLASQRRQFEETSVQSTVQEQQHIHQLSGLSQQLQAQLQQSQPSQQQLDQFRQEDPGAYSAYVIQRQEQERMLQAATSAADAEKSRQLQQRIPQERATLMRVSPEFNTNFEERYAQVGAWATSPNGGSLGADEWAGLVDARLVRLLELAMVGQAGNQAASARRPRIQKQMAALPKVRPGTNRDPGDTSRDTRDRAMKNLKESGGVRTDDIAAAFRSLGS